MALPWRSQHFAKSRHRIRARRVIQEIRRLEESFGGALFLFQPHSPLDEMIFWKLHSYANRKRIPPPSTQTVYVVVKLTVYDPLCSKLVEFTRDQRPTTFSASRRMKNLRRMDTIVSSIDPVDTIGEIT